MTSHGALELSISGLDVAYERDIAILRQISFQARAEQVTGIIGPNGAGKSTLLKSIAGLAPAKRGEILVGGRAVSGTPGHRLQEFGIAFVPQEHTVFPEMSVGENLRLGGWIRRRDKAWLSRRMAACCELFPQLKSRLTTPAGQLSGGQQRLLEIARGLICEPTVLLLDEPTVGLSPQLADEVYGQLASLPKRSGTTIVLVDQNVHDCLRIADYVYVLLMGCNDTQGSAASIEGRLQDIVQGWMQRKGSGLDVEAES